MSYSNNPLLPKARADAVRLVVEGHLPVSVATRKSGIHRTTLWRWLKMWQARGYRGYITPLPTKSSRPHSCSHAVSPKVVARIRYYRDRYGRCATVTHAYCKREGTNVSLSTVRRVLHRLGLVTRKKWQRTWRPPVPRPAVTKPGDLVQTDTVHLTSTWQGFKRTYLYTVIDVYSRFAYSEYHTTLSQVLAAAVVTRAQAQAGFHFAMVQADNGPEYGRSFEEALSAAHIAVRHSRVRRPNDNAHIERFNRSIQEECVGTTDPFSPELKSKVLTYLAYYNEERLHLGLECRTPREMLQRC